MNKITGKISAIMAILVLFSPSIKAQAAETQSAVTAITGPDAVDNQLNSDQEVKPGFFDANLLKVWDEWKGKIADRTGLSFGIDYNALGFAATESLGEDTSASGVFRVFGTWNLIGRGTNNTGGIVFKFENRHAYTDFAPNEFGTQLGYAGLLNVVFSDQGWRTTHLHWRQVFNNGRGFAYAGFLDTTDYVDAYVLASPWTGFSNLAFETGSGTIGGLPDGALGIMVGGFVSDKIYAAASIADANAESNDIGGGFDTFFNDFETFKSLEIGWTSSQPALYLVNNVHVSLWQIDEHESAETLDGWGVVFSASGVVGDQWMPFIRGGWAEDGGSFYEAALALGFGYQPKDSNDLLGVGLHWSRPNESTLGTNLEDQFTGEVFYRLQVIDKFALTPSIQLLVDPALNPDENVIAVFGLRARVAF
ncbi:carbohydrate porin [Desulfopila sp. IMCC35008]|uniref:carbohydrate porin n=1 Tax=Desulfopila sp. IMCC35008 TaxID=2653858 RepID=UPI0013D84D10|nr:carbohydrate porin [Desulfopila sp. IMCC35008]